MTTRAQSLLAIFVVWAAIYLPALGSLEIKGEEGRRILPAVRMLETGDASHSARETFRSYVVPRVGSGPYLRKPPLINWLVAASFKLFGQRNEWTARLPSALCLLAVALVFAQVAHASLGVSGSTIAAVIWLTNFGLIEKGRLIEIEALYVSLFAIAFVCWLTWWDQKRSPWLTWIVPWIFLGLGWLAKGPTHLFFFYAIMLAILWRTGELRTIWNVPHLIGLLIMASIFAAWAIPFAEITGGAHTAHVWSRQFYGRLGLEDFRFGSWVLNIPRSLGYFLPWLVLALFLAGAKFSSPRKTYVAHGLVWGISISLVIVDLVPGSLPRYTMPLIAPFAWLLAAVLTAETVTWPRWLGGKSFSLKDRQRTVAVVAIVACVCVCIYAFALVPRLQSRQKVKTIAAQIEAVVPEGEPLYAVDPDYQPFLFYVRRPIVYVNEVADLPKEAHYFLVQPESESAAETASNWLPVSPVQALSIQDYRHRRTFLFTVGKP